MEHAWVRLLDEQQYGRGITARGPVTGGGVGLTPAFLVGAVFSRAASAPTAGTRADLLRLLESIRDNDTGKVVTISECVNLHQPIASMTQGNTGDGDAVLLADGAPSRLFAWPQYFERAGRDVESLAEGLWRVLGASIADGRYSYRSGEWQTFNEDDLAFIDRALKDEDDA